MNIKIKKIGKIAIYVICAVVIVIAIVLMSSSILHNTYYKTQLKNIEPYGQMVEVENKNMHIYSMGDGEETIVLLPGHGVPLPSADFAPLMRKLSEKYKVVAVDYFGMGFSDETDKPRNCENYTNEIREALRGLDIKPPYILMPHSISGIYSEYYATKYPEEVKGMILLDTTSTDFTMEIPENILKQFEIAKFQQSIGIQRLVLSLISDETLKASGLGLTIENGYTEKEITDYKKYMCYSINDTIIEQFKYTMDCVKEVKQLTFPENIPVLKIISRETVESNDLNPYIGSEDYQKDHLSRLGDYATSVTLKGSHFIYHSQIQKISDLTDEFISNLEQ